MKLSEIIFESEADKFDVDKFAEDCSEYFEAVSFNTNAIIYHGTGKLPGDLISIRDFKERQKPQSIPIKVHNAFNDYFKKEFGWQFRNGLFTTGSKSMASDFGVPFAIFPIGKFEWLANLGINDLAYLYGGNPNDDGLSDGKFEQYLRDNKSGWRHNKDLPTCIKLGGEIMIKCDKFYMIDVDTYKEFKYKL